MSGRRGHQRLTIGHRAEGAVRIVRDVVIERIDHEELVIISTTAAVSGEEMSLELLTANGRTATTVTVRDSRPAVIDGAIRHRLRVAVMAENTQTQSDGGPLTDSPQTPELA